MMPDTPVKGMTVAGQRAQIELLRTPDYDGAYWTLKGVASGKYYIGIWYESSMEGLEAPQQYYGYIWVYLNGRRGAACEPFGAGAGVAGGVLRRGAVEDGRADQGWGRDRGPGRGVAADQGGEADAASAGAQRGHGWMFENYGTVRDWSLRLIAYCGYRLADGKGMWNHSCGMDNECDSPESLRKSPDGRAIAYYWVANPLPVPLTVKCKAEIRAYFREVVGSEEITLTLKPHERIWHDVLFTMLPDSKRYSMNVSVEAVDPPALDWPKADTIELLKGVRQSVPWHDPFRNEFRRCMSFRPPVEGVRQDVSLNGKWQSVHSDSNGAAFPAAGRLEVAGAGRAVQRRRMEREAAIARVVRAADSHPAGRHEGANLAAGDWLGA